MRVDAHHHLWRYHPVEYDWIDARMKPLQRDFFPADLDLEAAASSVTATIAIQARQSLQETDWLLDLASSSSLIQGVVGWAPIASPHFQDILAPYLNSPQLKGLRHVVQAEPAGFLDIPQFNQGIAALADTGLVYDILIFARQLEQTTRFVNRHPHQQFVLDHLAKPDILHDGFASWNTAIRELARRPNVACKLSGMVTEADWHTWTPALLQPYFDTVLEAFTPARLMIGSDWPVCTVACSYQQWWQTVSAWIAPLTHSERQQIEAANAIRLYRLTHQELGAK